MKENLQKIKLLIDVCSKNECEELLKYIRSRVNIHPLEEKLGCKAEIILEAISRASDLTLRGIRGIIAEAAFKTEVLDKLLGWKDVTPEGEYPFDFKIQDATDAISIQVKMQRQKNQRPMLAKEGNSKYSEEMYVVETQRTRGGISNGEATRPYKFNEFDILAVCMHPSSGNWKDFLYTPSRWLVPRPEDNKLLAKFQPVAMKPNQDWTDDLIECINWHRSGILKRITN